MPKNSSDLQSLVHPDMATLAATLVLIASLGISAFASNPLWGRLGIASALTILLVGFVPRRSSPQAAQSD